MADDLWADYKSVEAPTKPTAKDGDLWGDYISAPSAPFAAAPAAPNEGMPAPRGDMVDRALGAGWSAITGGRNLQADLATAREATAPPSFSDIGGNIALEARRAAEFAKAGGESAVANLKAGRPASAVLGAGQQILGGAGIALSPISGVVRSYVYDPISRMFGADTAERANLVANVLATPQGATATMRPAATIANVGGRSLNYIENIVRPQLNTLAEAVGSQGPDIANALRASKSGVESAGQVAAPFENVRFSKTVKDLAQHAEQTAANAAATQDALLAARSNMAEGRVAEGSRKLADVVAEPDMQKVGDKLISLANKEKKTSRQTVTGPAYNEFVAATEGQGTDISNITRRASELIDTIDQDAAAVLSRRLKKYQPTPTQTSGIGAGGAEYNIKTGEIPPLATAEDLNDIRSAINDAIGAAKAKNAAADLRRLNNLRQEVDKAVLNSTTFSDEAKAAWENANKVYSEQYVPRFKTGLQENLFKLRGNETAIASEDVVPKFMAGPTEVDQFVALFGQNPEAMDYARQGVEGMFRKAAIKNGAIDTKAADKFLRDYGAQIDVLDARGLGIRDKLTSLVDETARVTAPESRIAEVRGAIKGVKPPEGSSESARQLQVSELAQKTSPEDLTTLRDAVEIARRRGKFEELADTPSKIKTGVPEPIDTPSLLNLWYRIPLEVAKRVSKELSQESSRKLGELLSDPKRLNEAADLIEKALAMRAKQRGRVLPGARAPEITRAIPLSINALAPTPQNNLAYPAGQ